MKTLGLIGYPLTYSFSKQYFSQKFEKEGIPNYEYHLFPLKQITDFPKLLADHRDIVGLNVTIPYKEEIIPYLDNIDQSASFGAVNTIKKENGKLIGYNTDVYGFEKALLPILPANTKALVLGTGGAAKAVCFVLEKLKIEHKKVSRTPKKEEFAYDKLRQIDLGEFLLIVNTTPLGTAPNIDVCPDIPYELLRPNHVLMDLVYNPAVTQFLKNGGEKGSTLKNGLEMLYLQAEKAWEIWTT